MTFHFIDCIKNAIIISPFTVYSQNWGGGGGGGSKWDPAPPPPLYIFPKGKPTQS